MQDMIVLEDGREFMKMHSYCNGNAVGPVNESHSNSRSSSNSFISDLAPAQSNYLPPYTKRKPKSKMKFRVEYHEIVHSTTKDCFHDSDGSFNSD